LFAPPRGTPRGRTLAEPGGFETFSFGGLAVQLGEEHLEPAERRALEREHQRTGRLPRLLLDALQHTQRFIGLRLAALATGRRELRRAC
jgi:hypothetical protein